MKDSINLVHNLGIIEQIPLKIAWPWIVKEKIKSKKTQALLSNWVDRGPVNWGMATEGTNKNFILNMFCLRFFLDIQVELAIGQMVMSYELSS